MKVAVVGSRSLHIDDLGAFMPPGVTEIISGGAKGIDACARSYAQRHHLPIREYLPEYRRYGKGAPLKRNAVIVENADLVLIFWDGSSHGTKFVIDLCQKRNIPMILHQMPLE